MIEALRQARKVSWTESGVIPLAGGGFAQHASPNENLAIQLLRLCIDVDKIVAKPEPISWHDAAGVKRRYTADIQLRLDGHEEMLLEAKSGRALAEWPESLEKYEHIAASLKLSNPEVRLGLLACGFSAVFRRNVRRLSRYVLLTPTVHWPGVPCLQTGAVTVVAALEQGVGGRALWQVYAGIAQGALCTRMDAQLLNRTTLVSLPDRPFPPLRFRPLVSRWWA